MDMKILEGLPVDILQKILDTMNEDLMQKHRDFRNMWRQDVRCECKHESYEAQCKHVNEKIQFMFKREKKDTLELFLMITKKSFEGHPDIDKIISRFSQSQ